MHTGLRAGVETGRFLIVLRTTPKHETGPLESHPGTWARRASWSETQPSGSTPRACAEQNSAAQCTPPQQVASGEQRPRLSLRELGLAARASWQAKPDRSLAAPAQHSRSGIVTEWRRCLYRSPPQSFQPSAQIMAVIAKKRRYVSIRQVRPDTVSAQQEHIAGLQLMTTADSHFRDRWISTQATFDEIAHRMILNICFGDLAFP
jgi:hypothetical protein